MKCPKCGKEIANDSQFCEYCGTKINLVSTDEKKTKSYKPIWITLITIISALILGFIVYYQYDIVTGEREREQQRIQNLEQQAKAAQQQAENEKKLRLENQQRAQQELEKAEKARQEESRRLAEALEKERKRQAELAAKAEAERLRRNSPYIEQGYVDLGLPSGTLWKSTDENGFFDFDDANRKYGYHMPTKSQWEELIDNCSWKYINKDAGFKVEGRNNNCIYFPLKGCQKKYSFSSTNGNSLTYTTSINSESGEGYYFSSSSSGINSFYRMYFRRNRRIIEETNIEEDWEYSVRLVVRP